MSDFWVIKNSKGMLLNDTASLKKRDCVAKFMAKPSIKKVGKDFGYWKGVTPVRAILVEWPDDQA